MSNIFLKHRHRLDTDCHHLPIVPMVPIVPQSAPMVSVADVSIKLYHLCPVANSAMMGTLTHCQWEDEAVREGTGAPPSCAEAKKVSRYHFIPMAAIVLA